jgi:hypothetical protein
LSVAVPLIPLSAALTAVEPEAAAVANPLEVTLATAWVATVQLAAPLTSAVEPSLYCAVAANCCDALTQMLALIGDTQTDVSVFVGLWTVRVAVPLSPLNEAVIADEPAATPVARPFEVIVATA